MVHWLHCAQNHQNLCIKQWNYSLNCSLCKKKLNFSNNGIRRSQPTPQRNMIICSDCARRFRKIKWPNQINATPCIFIAILSSSSSKWMQWDPNAKMEYETNEKQKRRVSDGRKSTESRTLSNLSIDSWEWQKSFGRRRTALRYSHHSTIWMLKFSFQKHFQSSGLAGLKILWYPFRFCFEIFLDEHILLCAIRVKHSIS